MRRIDYARLLLGVVTWMIFTATADVRAESDPPWLTDAVLQALFPHAVHTGPLSGNPPAVPVYGAGVKLGYLFATSDIVDAVGFSGAPFTIAVGLDTDGVLTGVEIVEHAEPILDYNDSTKAVGKFFSQYSRLDFTGAARMSTSRQPGEVDGISSATVSARAFHSAIIQSARTVARSRRLRGGDVHSASIDVLRFESLGWQDLIDSGAVQHLDIPNDRTSSSTTGKPAVATTRVHVALLTPASVGRNLLSRSVYQSYVSSHSPRDLIFAIMSTGPFSFVGKQVFETGTFDRIWIAQDQARYTLVRQLGRYRYLPFVNAEGRPEFDAIGLFRVPAESGIDVLAPWDLVVRVGAGDEDGTAATEQRLRYKVPERFVLPPVDPREPEISPTRAAWNAAAGDGAILLTALAVLSVLLTMMRPLARRPRLLRVLRTSFLVFTVVWIGWIAGAQLSVINPIAWAQALASGAGLGMLATDPLLAILTVFVLVSFVLWGRGVFCGWLCPFGALQELLAGIARRLKLPAVTLSHSAHQRLWPVKYVVLAVLVAAALHDPATLGLAAEVEPFKTAISLKFERAWPFVVYACVLLVAGLFLERAFCRFLCPLGAVLAIGGKLRLRNSLQRREECGNPCQLCTRRCPISAIAPSGQINMDECFYCLDCQLIYHDEQRCPPLVNRRKRVKTSRSEIPVTANSV